MVWHSGKVVSILQMRWDKILRVPLSVLPLQSYSFWLKVCRIGIVVWCSVNTRTASLLLSQVAPFLHLFVAAVASFQKLRGDIDREPQIDGTTSSGIHLSQVEGGFEFKNVSFTYPSRPEVSVLDQISFSIPANKY